MTSPPCGGEPAGKDRSMSVHKTVAWPKRYVKDNSVAKERNVGTDRTGV